MFTEVEKVHYFRKLDEFLSYRKNVFIGDHKCLHGILKSSLNISILAVSELMWF